MSSALIMVVNTHHPCRGWKQGVPLRIRRNVVSLGVHLDSVSLNLTNRLKVLPRFTRGAPVDGPTDRQPRVILELSRLGFDASRLHLPLLCDTHPRVTAKSMMLHLTPMIAWNRKLYMRQAWRRCFSSRTEICMFAEIRSEQNSLGTINHGRE